ncbi:MAG TPA: ECF-type sigma factor [Albitalea sp.]|uniref:ECF-type sigma factor n=1 Tax=Piscinibacter sp. TaxID=1903157 RepID=UPI002ED17D01
MKHSTAESLPSAADAADASMLFTTLYDELRRLARREVWRNGGRDIVSTSTLVHEAWLAIGQRQGLRFDEPGQFLAYAARAMRGMVIDRIRATQAQKRGGDLVITSLGTHNVEQALQPESLDSMAEALDELATLEPELANVVELTFFGGFTFAEVARMHGVSERTVQRQWHKARMLLHRALSG